jgi:hypothetical protein
VNNLLRKVIVKAALPTAVFVILVTFSAFHAWRISADALRDEVAPPPYYSLRFALYPKYHIEEAHGFGFKPGWVITYVPRNKFWGTAFYVTCFGKMVIRGTPTIVTMQLRHEQNVIEKFRQSFARIDAKVQTGMTFSNTVAILGSQFAAITNNNGSFSAYFVYMPRTTYPPKWLTNGFSLLVSNNIVVRKDYSYTSSR